MRRVCTINFFIVTTPISPLTFDHSTFQSSPLLVSLAQIGLHFSCTKHHLGMDVLPVKCIPKFPALEPDPKPDEEVDPRRE